MSYMMVMMIQRDPKACKGSEEALNFAILVGFSPPRVSAAPTSQPECIRGFSHMCCTCERTDVEKLI